MPLTEAMCLTHFLQKREDNLFQVLWGHNTTTGGGAASLQHEFELERKGKFRIIRNRIWSNAEVGCSHAPLVGRSAAGEPLGRSPGYGCWGQLLCSAAVSGSPPGGGYHGDRLPCAKPCGREPVARQEKATWVRRGYTGEQRGLFDAHLQVDKVLHVGHVVS